MRVEFEKTKAHYKQKFQITFFNLWIFLARNRLRLGTGIANLLQLFKFWNSSSMVSEWSTHDNGQNILQ